MLLLISIVFITLLTYYLCLEPLIFWKLNRKVTTVFLNFHLVKSYLSSDSSFFHVFCDMYLKYVGSHRYIGTFAAFTPTLYLLDHNLIHQVMIKDFAYFTDRVNFLNDHVDEIAANTLFELRGNKWREMRSKFGAAFTAKKMRNMHKLMQQVANQFTDKLAESGGAEVEISKMFNKSLIDITANCAFGAEINSFLNENNIFEKIAHEINNPTRWTIVKAMIMLISPAVAKFFRLHVIPPSVTEFFHRFVWDTISYREKNNINRPDFIHLMMQARKGCLNDDEDRVVSSKQVEISDELLEGQFVAFFVAGTLTSSTILTALMYELAKNPHCQAQLQAEIDQIREECGEKQIPYDYLMKIKYLDQVLNETLRKWTTAYILNRECTRNYRIEAKLPHESDLIVQKGDAVYISIAGIHYNPEFYPNPEKFDPERFSPENAKNLVQHTFFPFGVGPRVCIARRFAMLLMKTIVVALLEEYTVKPATVKETKLRIANRFTTDFKDALWVCMEKRHK